MNEANELSDRLDHKIRPPELRVSLIARPRLLRMLDASVQGRLTLVHASAGYGKTTLLAQWREAQLAQGRAVAWLSFEKQDDDPRELLNHLLAALMPAVPGVLRKYSISTSEVFGWCGCGMITAC